MGLLFSVAVSPFPGVPCWAQQSRGDREAALSLQLFSWCVLDNLERC